MCPATTQEQAPQQPPPPPPLRDTTFRFQLYGPFFKIISYTYCADPALGLLRILPGTTRPLLVGTQAGDRRITPAMHDLWAYADLIAPRRHLECQMMSEQESASRLVEAGGPTRTKKDETLSGKIECQSRR
jgi:hypothetical protein